jgi:signal transduction histidine kinase
MSDSLHWLSIRFARGNNKLLLAYFVLIFAIISAVLTLPTAANPAVITANEICAVLWFSLIIALNRGMSLDMMCHLASIVAAIQLTVVAWYSGGIYSHALTWMAVLVTTNYFVIGRRAAMVWLGVYLAAHIAMAFSDTVLGFSPAVESKSIANVGGALKDQILILLVLTLLMVFYKRSDLAHHHKLIVGQQALEKETEILEQALRARDDFLSIVSADIVNPLRHLAHWSETANTELRNAPNTALVLDYSRRSAQRACLAIDELMEYSRMSSGQMKIQIASMEVREELQKALSQLQSMGHAGNWAYSLHTAANLPDNIQTDPTLFNLALIKLAQCAKEQSETGQILISAKLDDSRDLCISASAIRDQRAVTDPVNSQHLRHSSDSSTPAEIQNTGVAWAIAQSVAMRLEGESGVQNLADGSSRYWVRIPLEPKTSGPMAIDFF